MVNNGLTNKANCSVSLHFQIKFHENNNTTSVIKYDASMHTNLTMH